MKENNPKKGLSALVIVLLIAAICSVTTAVTLFVRQSDKKDNTPISSQPAASDENSGETWQEQFPPVDIPSQTENLTLQLQRKIIHLSSGAEVEYSYPQIVMSDNTALADKINQTLLQLTKEQIEPAVSQFIEEATPNATRSYSYALLVGQAHYSLVITLDINEGITPAREIFVWNFCKDSGEFFTLQEHCNDPLALALVIDGHIENIASYDQIIHDWLKEVVACEYVSSEFSFYFEEDVFVAVINKRLKTESLDRDPILIKIPYEKVSSLFTF